MSVWVTLPEHASATAFANHANRYGVLVASGLQFSSDTSDSPNLRIPFTTSPDLLEEGLQRLADAWRTFDRVPHSVRSILI